MAFDAPPEFELQYCSVVLFFVFNPQGMQSRFQFNWLHDWSVGGGFYTQVVTATLQFVKGRGLNKRHWPGPGNTYAVRGAHRHENPHVLGSALRTWGTAGEDMGHG